MGTNYYQGFKIRYQQDKKTMLILSKKIVELLRTVKSEKG